jgi:hypothetical protein
MKTEVYSWRVSPEVKAALEREARREKTSLAALLDRVARQWLEERKSRSVDDAAEQARLHAAVEKCIGTIKGGDPHRAESASRLIRESLARKYGR